MPKPIEKGWLEYRRATLDPINAPRVQIEETRKAWYFGAGFMFGTLVAGMSSGEEPSAEDLQLMDDVKAEIDGFMAQMRRRYP